MKFIKKCLSTTIILISIILFVIIIGGKTNATTNSNEIIVTGQITDNNNQNIRNVEVSFIDTSTNTIVEKGVTDSNGEYIVNIPEGNYKINFKYPQNYDTKKIDIKKYELYDKNLELGLVYNNELENKLTYLDAKFTDNTHDFRIIKNSYSKDGEIEQQIHNLQLNSESEHAFHDLIYEGYKGVTVILSDKQEEVNSYVKTYLNDDYNCMICSSNESISNILDKIYTKLGNSAKYLNKEAIESKNDNSATTIELNLSSATIINANIEEKDVETNPGENLPGSTPGSGEYADFISGEIKVGNELHNGNVIIKLINTNTGGVKNTVNTNNGKYFMKYPGKGKYKLEFEFENTNEFNGQYYEADNSSNNCMKETNRNNIKNYYKNVNYENEGKLDNYTSNIAEKIKGESTSFSVLDISENYNPNDNKIIKNVQLKEREKFSLTVEENVNKYKIILSNGQIFKEYDLKSNPNNENYKLRLFNITMETKLSYGAKLLVEYEIKVKNNSNIDCTGYTLVNRFENLEFDKEQYLLSNTKTKNGDDWKIISNSDVKTLTGNSSYDDGVTDLITYLKLQDNDGIKANKEENYYVALTRPLDAENDSTIFAGKTELVQYKNNQGRRNYENINLTGDAKDSIIKAGNYSKTSEDIAILPPTGFDIKTMCLLIISTIICLFGFKYLISNKLYINLRKTKIRRKWNRY